MDTRDLKGHMAVKHGAPKAYKCTLCDEAFPYNNMLKSHLVKFHHVFT